LAIRRPLEVEFKSGTRFQAPQIGRTSSGVKPGHHDELATGPGRAATDPEGFEGIARESSHGTAVLA